MSDAADQATALLDIALETYAQEIIPTLPKDKRYAGAMVANAFGIAQRRLSHTDPGKALVEALGAESLESLAKSIRSGTVSNISHSKLANSLMTYLDAEVAITNPKFLARRKGA